jgi:hypothetical protein
MVHHLKSFASSVRTSLDPSASMSVPGTSEDLPVVIDHIAYYHGANKGSETEVPDYPSMAAERMR